MAREQSSDLIVVSTHGLTGMRKLFFGSTTERVLRETTTPVLVTPAHDPGPIRLEDGKQLIGRIIVPVDLPPRRCISSRSRGASPAHWPFP